MANNYPSVHYPGHNYTGPGTNVINNILKGVKPTNINDYYAALHDLHCIGATGCSINANKKYHEQLGGVKGMESKFIGAVSKLSDNLGITSRLTINNNVPFTKDEIRDVVKDAKQILMNENPQFAKQSVSSLEHLSVKNLRNERTQTPLIQQLYDNAIKMSTTTTKMLDDF